MNSFENKYAFIDGLGPVNMIEGVVRMELLSITGVEKDKVSTERTGGLAVSLSGFLKMHEQMGRVIEEMAQKGVIQKREPVADNSNTEKKHLNKKTISLSTT
jgi:hypothetical protein